MAFNPIPCYSTFCPEIRSHLFSCKECNQERRKIISNLAIETINCLIETQLIREALIIQSVPSSKTPESEALSDKLKLAYEKNVSQLSFLKQSIDPETLQACDKVYRHTMENPADDYSRFFSDEGT